MAIYTSGISNPSGTLAVPSGSLDVVSGDTSVSGALTSSSQSLSQFAQNIHYGAVVKAFLYDTSKDSDGGAWRKRCAHTSWYNESINSRWLGWQTSDLNARYARATLGSELVTNGTFTNDVSGWASSSSYGGSAAVSTGKMIVTSTVQYGGVIASVTTAIGKTYRISGDLSAGTGTASLNVVSANGATNYAVVGSGSGTVVAYYTATATTTYLLAQVSPEGAGSTAYFDNISVKEVTAAGTESGDYYQSTTDGKYYRLYKNLLTYSEQFDNAAWTKYQATITANAAVAPDGTTTADKLVESAATGAHGVYAALTSVTGAMHTWSVYAKAGERSWLYFGAYNGAGTKVVYFNLSNGTVGTTASGATATITAVGGGWYRCAVTTVTAGTSITCDFYTATADSTVNYAGDGTSGVYIWGAQLEVGSTATAYETKTTAGSAVEVFRGNVREFPALVGIVAESARVVLYDLTAPGAPMWMVIKNTGFIDGPNLSLAALNGILCVAGNGNGTVILRFVSDTYGQYHPNGVYRYPNATIAYRNTTQSGKIGPDTSVRIVNDVCNDVALTVLDNAPIDPATGLAIPTIAVATGGGTSVITDSGPVVNSASTASHGSVSISTSRIMFTSSQGTGTATWYAPMPVSASFGAVGNVYNQVTGRPATALSGNDSARSVRLAGGNVAIAYDSHLNVLRENPSDITKGMVAYITNAYNTGWMPGDIRLATLADTTAETIAESGELVSNGTFTTNTAGWTAMNGAVLSVVSGELCLTNGATNYGYCYQEITTVAGKSYVLTLKEYCGTTTQIDVAVSAVGGGQLSSARLTNTVAGTYTVTFTATTTTTSIAFVLRTVTVGHTAYFDNVSVKLCEPDRSVSGLGAVVNGSLTKSAVASGAQLVLYSGWSAANYLEVPFTTKFDFATGEFSVSGLMLTGSNVTTTQYIVDRSDGDGSPRLYLLISAGVFEIGTVADGGATSYLDSAASSIAANTLYQFVAGRTSAGLFIYLNSVASSGASSAPSTLRNITSASAAATLRIGVAYNGSNPFLGSLGPIRVSATAMSADQSGTASRDELAMCQPGTQVTIAGTSTAVTALSYDDATDLLQVGTSWGRTSFNNLVRVDSEATSVGAVTSISATGGAILTGGASSGRYYQPAQSLRDELKRKEESRKALGKIPVFLDFDAVTSQVAFVLPKGYTTKAVYSGGTLKREGAAKDWTRSSDGFAETVTFGVAPGNGVWVTVMAVKGD